MRRSRRLSPAEAEQSGNALVDLIVADEDAGLGGRYLLEMVKRRRSPLPWTRLGVGSPVLLSAEISGDGGATRGVISEKDDARVRVALAELPDDLADHETWRIDLAHDE